MLHLVDIGLICAAGFFLLCLLGLAVFKSLSVGWSLKTLFKDFNRKIWMTCGLGFLFFGFYLFTVLLSAYLINGIDLFFLAYKNPIPFIYGGLAFFAFITVAIYFARMVIKYLYLTRGKDS